MLWICWAHIVWQLKPAFKDFRTFHWFIVICAAFTIRSDYEGVTSFIRTGLIHQKYYQSVLDFFHSKAINSSQLAQQWCLIVLRIFSPFTQKINGRILLVGDGLIATKEGRKMPASKLLHQSSNNNSKAEYVMGHYIQLISIIAGIGGSFFAVPLAAQIHLGFKKSPNESKSLFIKMLEMIQNLNISRPSYFVGDAYYSCQSMASGLIKLGSHIVTRVKHNAVAYLQPEKIQTGPGRPPLYGEKVKLNGLFKTLSFISATSPVYGETNVVLEYAVQELLWRPLGILVKFIFVKHPRGKIILMTTDPKLTALDIIKAYGLRFKIEVSIKVAIHRFGTFCYHFWLKSMKPIKRKSGGQYLHRATENYKELFHGKLDAYQLFIQVGLIAQGITQFLSLSKPLDVWATMNTWIRTMNASKCPSEHIVQMAMQDTKFEFLLSKPHMLIFHKFLHKITALNNNIMKTG